MKWLVGAGAMVLTVLLLAGLLLVVPLTGTLIGDGAQLARDAVPAAYVGAFEVVN